MSAVLIEVEVGGVERDAGIAALRDHIVPAISQMPGFRSGTWLTGDQTGRGLSLTVWETAEDARAFSARFGPGASPAAGATVVRCELREVAATAMSADQAMKKEQPMNTSTDRDHVDGQRLPTISDEYMREQLAGTRQYTLVLLRATDKLVRPDVDQTIWEHGRRNFALREHGALPIVMPIADDSEWAGIGIFTGSVEQVSEIMDHDPGVQAGIFTYEAHPVRGFPGSSLPG